MDPETYEALLYYCKSRDDPDAKEKYPAGHSSKKAKRNLRDMAKPYFMRNGKLMYCRTRTMSTSEMNRHRKRQDSHKKSTKKRPGKAFVQSEPTEVVTIFPPMTS